MVKYLVQACLSSDFSTGFSTLLFIVCKQVEQKQLVTVSGNGRFSLDGVEAIPFMHQHVSGGFPNENAH